MSDELPAKKKTPAEDVTQSKPKRRKTVKKLPPPTDIINDDIIQSQSIRMTQLIDGFKLIEASRDQVLATELAERLHNIYYRSNADIIRGLKTCEHVLGENLEDYVVIGHTFSGERIKIEYAKTSKDKDSLREAVKEYAVQEFTRRVEP